MASVRIFNVRTGKTEETEKVVKSDDEWRRLLTPEQFEVTRRKETEAPFTGVCPIPPSKSGLYQCVCCGTDLFDYQAKYESGSGWPSFFQPVSDLNVRLEDENSLGMRRTEILCVRCDAHLGHVFDDGPPPTANRYCINAAALKLANK